MKRGNLSAAGAGTAGLPLPDFRPVMIAALLTVLAMILTVGGWAMAARLDAAFVTAGLLHSDSELKTVESLEGGILAQLFVRPGDRVAAGQVVARLNATQIDEQIIQIAAERERQILDIWRLTAERAGTLPDPAAAPGEAEGIAAARRPQLVAEAVGLSAARASAHAAEIEALERQIAQLEDQIAAGTGQAAAAETQLGLWSEEHRIAERLADSGSMPRVRLLELERAIAATRGDRDESAGLVSAAREDIARARAEITALSEARQAGLAADLTAARAALMTLDSRLRAATDVRERLSLRAPQTGRVVDIALTTPGAVLGSGVALMTILPEEDDLVALVRVPPAVIDNLSAGAPAEVRLTAYRRVDVPVLPGRIAYVSADQLEDPRTGQSYFEARIALDPDAAAALEGARILAGMPVEVTVPMGSRRAGDYLLEPLLRFSRHALREE